MDAQKPNMRDIDQIIAAVKQHIPEVIVSQLQTKHASDDNGLWWFGLREGNHDVQIENANGMCPFLIETDTDQACTTHSVDETVQIIVYTLAHKDTNDDPSAPYL
jgi:hypothetical protein